MKVLRQGLRGAEVIMLQQLLNALPVTTPKLRPDGVFGKNTFNAVIQFQNSKELTQDGIVGRNTWRELGIKDQGGLPIQPIVASITRWMPLAKAELGIHENSAVNQHNRRIIEYHSSTTLRATTDEIPWCSSFVNWVMLNAGYRGTNSALARSWLSWGKTTETPSEGTIVVIQRTSSGGDSSTGSSTGYHVAFFIRMSSTYITLLGGNQSNSVRQSNFRLSSYDIKGYRLPS